MRTDSGGLRDLSGIFDRLASSKYFTALDLASGFFQIPIKEEHKSRAAFRDARGQGRFSVQNVAQCIIRIHFESTRRYRRLLCTFCFDNILIHSTSFEEYLKHIERY
ncbi:unnamed protein product [Discosporangium mesarthrocarpum]